jgi:predicted NAD/FAD-dependent oxidoreductase
MAEIAHAMARDVDLAVNVEVVRLRRTAGLWEAALANGELLRARALVLTPPVPVSLDLLRRSEVALSREHRARLESMRYDRCLAVLALLEGPSQVPPPGGLAQPIRGDAAPIAWIADNQAKGISAVPAVTIHASAAFSLAHWEQDRRESGRALIEAAAPWLGSAVTAFEVHGWRYAKPAPVSESGCLRLCASPPLLLAGDALGGPRVEGAALSGWAAADALPWDHNRA